jgi:hypothetical protein
VLAYFDRPGTSNGPTEAINGRLEHLRGSALGFRNLTNYIARSLLESGGFRPDYTPDCEEPLKDPLAVPVLAAVRGACAGPRLPAQVIDRSVPDVGTWLDRQIAEPATPAGAP